MRASLLALMVLAVASFLPAPPAPPPVLSGEERPDVAPALAPAGSIDELKARIGKLLADEQVPGMAIALVDRDGPIWIGGIGVADVETGAPMTGDTTFRVGSLTKSFIVLGLLQQVERGKLDLDAPVRGVELDNPYDTPVTTAMLLEHTAGIEDMRPNEFFAGVDDLPAADALAINPRSRIVRWKPGSRHAYSNVGYTIAARQLELATGEPFDTYLTREVLRPMGIPDAAFQRTPSTAERLATGYVEPGRPAKFSPLAHRPAGALLASARDLSKLVELFLRRGDGIVSPASVARIERNGTLRFAPTAVSYGLANYGDVGFPIFARGHNAGMPGYSTELRYFPSIGRGYVMLLNSTYDGSWFVQHEIRREVFAFLAKGAATTPPSAPADPPGADYFAYAAPRSELFAVVDNVTIGWNATMLGDRVRLDPLRSIHQSGELVPAGDGAYRHDDECGSSVRFATAEDGTPVMLYYGVYTEASSSAYAHVRLYLLGIAMMLLHYAAPVGVLAILLARVRRRRIATDVLLWNAVSGLCCAAIPRLFFASAMRDEVGVCCPLTVTLCAVTILFAVSASAALFSALRWFVRADRPALLDRIAPTITAVFAFGFVAWLALNGVVGLRTWAF